MTMALRSAADVAPWRRAARATLAAAFVLVPAVALCDVPTPQQDCEIRNAARCEINGVEFVESGGCPPRARTLRPAGTENCAEAGRDVRPMNPRERATAPGIPTEARTAGTVNGATTPRSSGLAMTAGWLAVCLAIVVVFWRRGRRAANDGGGAEPRRLVRRIAATLVGLAATCAASLWVFFAVLRHYANGDTAGPAIVGAIAALVAFVVLLYPLLALSGRLLAPPRRP